MTRILHFRNLDARDRGHSHRHHEEDEQHQADVDERDHVDVFVAVVRFARPIQVHFDRGHRLGGIGGQVWFGLREVWLKRLHRPERIPVGRARRLDLIVRNGPTLLAPVGDHMERHFLDDVIRGNKPEVEKSLGLIGHGCLFKELMQILNHKATKITQSDTEVGIAFFVGLWAIFVSLW